MTSDYEETKNQTHMRTKPNQQTPRNTSVGEVQGVTKGVAEQEEKQGSGPTAASPSYHHTLF